MNEGNPDMVLSRAWTGVEASALQEACRLSVREFAQLLSIDPRTVTNWTSGGRRVRPRPFTQQMLDEVLARADKETQQRFHDMVNPSPSAEVAVISPGREPDQWPPSPSDFRMPDDLRAWIEMNRRQLLQLFGGTAFGLPAVAAILAGLDGDERARVEKVLITPSRVDTRAVDDIEAAWRVLDAQNITYGPRVVLPMVEGQIAITEALLRECPDALRVRLHDIRGGLAQLSGWMRFDLHEFTYAARHYEEARRSAHKAENSALAGLALCNLSYLAVWSDEPRTGIDHAVAAQTWARRSQDQRLESYADSIAAYAYAAAGQREECLTALDQADAVIATAPIDVDTIAPFSGAGLAASVRSDCLHQLGDGRRALQAAETALDLIDPHHRRNWALAHLDRATAYTDLGEIEAAAHSIGECVQIAASCPSDRLTGKMRAARAALDKWTTTAPVRALDDELAPYGISERT